MSCNVNVKCLRSAGRACGLLASCTPHTSATTTQRQQQRQRWRDGSAGPHISTPLEATTRARIIATNAPACALELVRLYKMCVAGPGPSQMHRLWGCLFTAPNRHTTETRILIILARTHRARCCSTQQNQHTARAHPTKKEEA